MELRGPILSMQRATQLRLTGRAVNDPRPDNPYPQARPHLRRAYAEGARAASPETPPRDYVCGTRAQRLAWLKGFLAGRIDHTSRNFAPGINLDPDLPGA